MARNISLPYFWLCYMRFVVAFCEFMQWSHKTDGLEGAAAVFQHKTWSVNPVSIKQKEKGRP